MKKIIFVVISLCLSGAALGGGAAAPSAGGGVKFRKYAMDHGYFTCLVPASWSISREKERDEDYKIFEIQLLSPKSEKSAISVFVSYYGAENDDFDGYEDYIDRNSTNALGETKSERESYEPVKKIKLGGRRAFVLARERLVYLHPEAKSEESVKLGEKIYVLPAKQGFYVLHFSAPADAYAENLPVFERVAKSFKGKP